MEILLLVIGLIIGGLFIWLTNRSKVKHEYDRARAELDNERATLAARLARGRNMFSYMQHLLLD